MKVSFEGDIPPGSSISKHYLPLYASRVECGLFGIVDDFVDDYLSLDERFVKNKSASFFVKANGDSMAPNIISGDILIVDRSVKIFNGAVATFFYNNDAICKQYFKKQGEVILRSFNKDYEDIKLSREDHLELFGVVMGLARNFY